jgi:hypothetical protein
MTANGPTDFDTATEIGGRAVRLRILADALDKLRGGDAGSSDDAVSRRSIAPC